MWWAPEAKKDIESSGRQVAQRKKMDLFWELAQRQTLSQAASVQMLWWTKGPSCSWSHSLTVADKKKKPSTEKSGRWEIDIIRCAIVFGRTATSQGAKGLMRDTVRTITLKHNASHLITAVTCPAQIEWPLRNNRVWKPLPLDINNHSMKITQCYSKAKYFWCRFLSLQNESCCRSNSKVSTMVNLFGKKQNKKRTYKGGPKKTFFSAPPGLKISQGCHEKTGRSRGGRRKLN